LVFVSGTASITESESRFPENPEKQTEQTLDNIAALIDSKNLERHGISGFVSDLGHLKSTRVYVKRPNELAVIKRVCDKRLGNIPILYTIADVCRPELLVEIEGFVAVNRD
jgi:enamine deaminase RidA (YjgF/YER057c/UK114 family)